jgi:hypothetical protein
MVLHCNLTHVTQTARTGFKKTSVDAGLKGQSSEPKLLEIRLRLGYSIFPWGTERYQGLCLT